MERKLLLILMLLLCCAPAVAQKAPLQVDISVFNGASDLMANGPEAQDSSIRLVLSLTNLTAKKITISRMACTFFDSEGHQLAQDQAQPLTLNARDRQSAVLFYPNAGGLYAFRAVGVIEYEQNGQSFSLPIDVDQSQAGSGQPIYR